METKVHYSIIVVGAGGTGGNLLKELGRFLSCFHEPDRDWSLVIIDGDTVENKNTERQPFGAGDIMQNKALVMQEGLCECFGLPEHKVSAKPGYINTVHDLAVCHKAVYGGGHEWQEVLVLVGTVDNHRARQVLHGYFNKYTGPCIYIDCANEYSAGEVVVGVRMNKQELAPPRGYYFPDVLTDRSPSASELSCGAVNVSAPQHAVTNLTAAIHCLSFIAQLLKDDNVEGGILYFDAFRHFSRWQPWQVEGGTDGE